MKTKKLIVQDHSFSILAHEIRNPLSVISNIAKSFKYIKPGDILFEEQTAALNRQILNITNIINDLNDISNIKRNKITLHKQISCVNILIKNAIEMSSSAFKDKNQDIFFEEKESSFVDVDPTKIIQVLANIITNAKKFSPENSRICLYTKVVRKRILISIKDEGIGVTEDKIKNLFEPFFQINGKKYGGLGLGLALSKQIAKLHKGTITAASEGFSKGSVFTLSLPIKTDIEKL